VEHALAQFLVKFTYVALLAVLAAAGLGVPIPEDLTLLLAGGLAARNITSYWPTLATGYFGVVLGDVLIHRWGWRIGAAAYDHPRVVKHLSRARQEKLRQHFERHGFLTIVVGRHTPMLRAPIFFLAGASRLPLWKFLLADALSSAVTVPIVVTLGFYFGEHLDDLRAKIHQVQWIAVAAVAVGIVIWWVVRRKRSALAGRSPDDLEAPRSPGRHADQT
jgi:membrane protein DedA with SNARE-associated domain